MKNKIFIGLSIVILIGIIVVAIFGFNVDLCYSNYNLVDITIGQEYNISDIQTITNEVFPNQKVEIQKSGVYSDNVSIKVLEISEEQKNTLNTKINEKYGLENKVEDMVVNYIPNYRLIDIVKPYIVPLIISTILILTYMGIRFKQLGALKVVSETIISTLIAEVLFVSIIAITRFPINRLIMPAAIVLYTIIITVLTGMYEKQKSMKLK